MNKWKKEINTEKYHESTEFSWESNSYVKIQKMGINSIELQANPEGLRSLAAQLLKIADGDYEYVFYQAFPGDLEEGSLELQITKLTISGR